MKTFTFLLIFSGLTGLNKCSSDIKIDVPFFNKNIQNKTEENNDTELNIFQSRKTDSLTYSFVIPNYNFLITEEHKNKILWSKNLI